MNKSLELDFWPILNVKLSFVFDRLSMFVNLRRRYCHTGWAKIKLQTFVHIFTK